MPRLPGRAFCAAPCDGGTSLAVRACSTGSANGSVVIRNSRTGLNMSQCDATVVNGTPVASNLPITGWLWLAKPQCA